MSLPSRNVLAADIGSSGTAIEAYGIGLKLASHDPNTLSAAEVRDKVWRIRARLQVVTAALEMIEKGEAMKLRRLTIRLTDDEYASLEAQAEMERRSVREQAERLVTKPHVRQPWSATSTQSVKPRIGPRVTSGAMVCSCYACEHPDSTAGHICSQAATWDWANAAGGGC